MNTLNTYDRAETIEVIPVCGCGNPLDIVGYTSHPLCAECRTHAEGLVLSMTEDVATEYLGRSIRILSGLYEKHIDGETDVVEWWYIDYLQHFQYLVYDRFPATAEAVIPF